MHSTIPRPWRPLAGCLITGIALLLPQVAAAQGSKKAPAKTEKKASESSPKEEDSSDKAAEEKAPEAASEGDKTADDSKAEGSAADEKKAAAATKTEVGTDRADASNSPIEKPGTTYYFVGARYRAIIVPKFMMNLFGEGGTTVVAHSFGPEFGIRKDKFEYSFGLSYASYAMDDTAFKAKNDPPQSWELVQSKIKVLYLTADFLWSQPLTPALAFNYGFGAGVGFLFGDLIRTQAEPDPANPGGYKRCPGPSANNSNPWCTDENNHYNNYSEPSWANGGSKPILFPWLALQTGLRFKPHRNFATRLDAGFGTSGFFLGLGADYGL